MIKLTAILALTLAAASLSSVTLAQDGGDRIVPRMIASNEAAMSKIHQENVAKMDAEKASANALTQSKAVKSERTDEKG